MVHFCGVLFPCKAPQLGKPSPPTCEAQARLRYPTEGLPLALQLRRRKGTNKLKEPSLQYKEKKTNFEN